MAIKGRSTQSLVNNYPLWSSIRTDEQSLGYQIFNPIGVVFDDLLKQIEHADRNRYISTSLVNDIDTYYSYRLPGDYEFTKTDGDNTQFEYTPPTVSGVLYGQKYEITLAEKNDIESFWYTTLPTRLSLVETVNAPHLLASGYIYSSPFIPLTVSGECHIPNRLTIRLSGGVSYIGISEDNQYRISSIKVDGTLRNGLEVKEELTLVMDETRTTIHEYSSVNSVKVYGIEPPKTTEIFVTSANFNAPDHRLDYSLDVATHYNEEMPLFFSLGSGIAGQKTLDLSKFEIDEIDLRVQGFPDKYVIVQQELLDTGGNNITPVDMTIEPNTDNLWVVDHDTIYLYTSKIPYQDLSLLKGKQYDAASVIEPSSYYAVKGDAITLDYVWRRPSLGFVSHRVWVEKPDGNLYSLEDGSEVTYHTDTTSWFIGEPLNKAIRASEDYVLDQYGDYVYTLECRYTDNSTSVDKRIISVLTQTARTQLSLSSITIPTVAGIDFDSEGKLWVLDINGVKYQVERHYDTMLIDYERKLIYLREPYSQIRVY